MRIRLDNEENTVKLGKCMAELLLPGMVLLLVGDLGAGKTTLARGVIKSLGVEEPITSPTFTLLNLYQGDMEIAHIDAYRLADSQEGYEAGLEEYLPGRGITIIEWPENIKSLIPEQFVQVSLEYAPGENSREAEIIAMGEQYIRMLRELEAGCR